MSTNKFDEKMDYLLDVFHQRFTREQELFDATAEELATLQEVTSHQLPTDYIEFMSKYAGASVEAEFPLSNGEVGYIAGFLPIDLNNTFALPQYYRVARENIPPHLFPIAEGDRFSIYLSLRDTDLGHIYFSAWEEIGDVFEDHLQLTATNFSDFVDLLKPF